MLRLIGSLLTMLIIILFVLFTSRNPGVVQLDYYFGQYPVPVAVLVIGGLFVGVLLGLLLSISFLLKAKRNMFHLKRKVKVTEQEVNNLRTIPIKDSH